MNEFRIDNATGEGIVAITIDREDLYKLAEIRLTLSAATTDLGEFVVRLDSELGADYDTILATPDPNDDLAAATSFRFADPVPPVIFPGDKVLINWPNAGLVTWAIDIIGTR